MFSLYPYVVHALLITIKSATVSAKSVAIAVLSLIPNIASMVGSAVVTVSMESIKSMMSILFMVFMMTRKAIASFKIGPRRYENGPLLLARVTETNENSFFVKLVQRVR